jgi:hypothetical protein
MRRFFKWQSFEIHPVDTGDSEGRQSDGTEDGEDLHYLVGAVGDGGSVDVESVVEQVALGFNRVEKAGDVVVGVSDVELVVGVDDSAGIALEMEGSVTSVDEDELEDGCDGAATTVSSRSSMRSSKWSMAGK